MPVVPGARPYEPGMDKHLAPDSGSQAEADLDETGVRAAFATLPLPQRRVLYEVHYRGRSVAETARILQIPPGTVKSRTYYALHALRRALAAHAPDPPKRRDHD
jgi:RNA polymerase sigma-70 factor, ECF subfamily